MVNESKEGEKEEEKEEEEEEEAALRRLNLQPPGQGCFPCFASVQGLLVRMSRDGREKNRPVRAEASE